MTDGDDVGRVHSWVAVVKDTSTHQIAAGEAQEDRAVDKPAAEEPVLHCTGDCCTLDSVAVDIVAGSEIAVAGDRTDGDWITEGLAALKEVAEEVRAADDENAVDGAEVRDIPNHRLRREDAGAAAADGETSSWVCWVARARWIPSTQHEHDGPCPRVLQLRASVNSRGCCHRACPDGGVDAAAGAAFFRVRHSAAPRGPSPFPFSAGDSGAVADAPRVACEAFDRSK